MVKKKRRRRGKGKCVAQWGRLPVSWRSYIKFFLCPSSIVYSATAKCGAANLKLM